MSHTEQPPPLKLVDFNDDEKTDPEGPIPKLVEAAVKRAVGGMEGRIIAAIAALGARLAHYELAQTALELRQAELSDRQDALAEQLDRLERSRCPHCEHCAHRDTQPAPPIT